jgi:hypothetical protein
MICMKFLQIRLLEIFVQKYKYIKYINLKKLKNNFFNQKEKPPPNNNRIDSLSFF